MTKDTNRDASESSERTRKAREVYAAMLAIDCDDRYVTTTNCSGYAMWRWTSTHTYEVFHLCDAHQAYELQYMKPGQFTIVPV